MKIAVIGGGIAGMAAAYELQNARAGGVPIAYTLFEARPRLGGVIASETIDGGVLECGPDSFLSEKPAAAELCRELGLGDQLIPSNDAGRQTLIAVRNRLVPLPDGLMFLVPTRLLPTALSPLFSLGAKLRMARELLLPPRPSQQDESVAAFVGRHFGPELVDRLAGPLLSGIYGGDAAQLSARSVLPKLVDMETRHGSLSRGMLAAHREVRARAAQKVSAAPDPAQRPPRGVFTTLRDGLQQLIDALEACLDPACLRRSTAVDALEKTAAGWRVTTNGHTENYDAVILASPAWAAGAMLARVDAGLAGDLAAIPYSSSITVNLVYDETQLGRLPQGFGFLVPTSEGRAMLACTFAHRKFLGRTPTGKVVLRAFLGGARNAALLDRSDAALVAVVRRELSEILGEAIIAPDTAPDTAPEHARVSRWGDAMAQYAVGHQERMVRVQDRVAAHPGLRLAGNAYDGIGISDCIRLGRQAARELVATVSTAPVATP
ncbi:MAG TPA: protoporphyrinogen oxidase [Terracidiphilus sp.]|nr:protoporphyrinogen oxidase [Terracidiphilus sp.]